jgi:HlyD family secretion protein
MPVLTPSTSAKRPDRARRRAIVRWTKRIGLGVVGGGIVAALIYAWLPKPTVVELATASRSSLESEIAEDGQTRVRERFVVSAPITGELQRIDLEPGAAVAAGDVIAMIRPSHAVLLDTRTRREATARLAVAVVRQRSTTTAIERATTARDAAVREADRARTLAQRGAITVSERERSELTEQLAIRDLAGAVMERTTATAEVDAARTLLDDSRAERGERGVEVTAPAAGQILRVVRDSAGPVATGAPLVELGDPRAIEVLVDVLSSDGARVLPGMVVSIERWGGDALGGQVRRVEPSAFTRVSALGVEEQRVRVIASVDRAPPALGDGFRVAARIITWHGDHVLTIPASALFRDHGSWSVYLAAAGRARLQPVHLGHLGRLDVEIESGLSEGDQVIVHPGDSIRPGARVVAR